MKKILVGSYLLMITTCLHAQKFEQLTKLVAADRAVENNLGTAVAISGNYAVIAGAEIPSKGAPSNCNCVYVYEKNSTGEWKEIQKLIAPDAADGFGFSVSISGSRVVVGAPNEDLDDKGGNSLVAAGAAYVFERNSSGTWVFTKKLISTDRGSVHQFGYSVSISNARVLIGAPNQAAAYLYERIDAGNWKPWCKIIAPDGAGNAFGHSVSISGEDMVIGAPGESKDTTNVTVSGGGANPLQSAGAAYLYKGASDDWKKMFNHKIVYWNRAEGDQFGYAVSMSGDQLVIGAPFEDEDGRQESTIISAGAAHVFFKRVDGTWFWTNVLVPNDRAVGDNFGISACISGDMIVVGAVVRDEMAGDIKLKDAGAAYVFKFLDTYEASGWRFFQKIVATDRAENDWFGYSVGLSKDNIIVGAPLQDRNNTRLEATDAGAGYIFTKPTCIATTSSLSVAVCKTYTSPSKKYTWIRSGVYKDTVLNKADCDSIITINLTITNKADTSVTKKGHVLTANAKDASYQWIDCATNQPINITTRSLIATVNGSYKVTIDQDGCIGTSSCHKVVVVAKPDSAASTPIVTTPPVVLPRNASAQKAFIEVNKIVANDRTHNDEFGRSVSISGNYAVIGVPLEHEDINGKNPVNGAGAAYIFKLDDGGKWKQLQKIVASDRGAGDNFGCSVGISGGYIVVGSNRDHKDVAGIKDNHLSGSAYIFELNQNGTWYLKQKITADPDSRGGQEYFGTAVAVEGNTIVVSAPDHAKDVTNRNESNVTAAGALYVFDRLGDTWVQTQKIVANDRELGSGLGNSVAICGNNIIGGAWGNDHDAMRGNRMDAAGAAYIFERKGGKWVQTQKLVANDRTAYDEFGFSVAISGDYAVVGARNVTEKRGDEDNGLHTGNAYVFKRNAGGGWSQQMKIDPDDRTKEDYLGTAVGISGNYLIVSAPGQDTDSLGNYMPNAGAVYVYYLDKSGNWILSDKISTFYKHQLDGFGHAAAISDCNIIGTSWVDQTDEEDKNAETNAGAASIFTAAGCNNDGRCSGRLFPWDKTPIDRTQSASNNSASNTSDNRPQKIESTDLKGDANEVAINTINLGNEGLTQPININNPKPRSDSVKTVNSPYDFRNIDMCIDRPQTGTLPARPAEVSFPVIPAIKEDGVLEEVSSIKQSLAALSEKMWMPGDSITVGFRPSPYYKSLRDSIKKYVKEWEYVANIRFVFVDDVTKAIVKIGFNNQSATSWAKLGRDMLNSSSNDSNMIFGMINTDVQLGYFRQRVLHEFGHALGFIHEHQSPAGGIAWDKEKVYAYFSKPPASWSRAMVDEHVFYKYSNSYTNSSVYDKSSIMHYYYPKDLTTDGSQFKQNMKLSAIDSDYAREVYPFPPEPKNASGMLRTGDDCDEIVFTVDYKAQGVADYEVDFILEPGIDHHGNWVTWWKKIGIPLKGGGEAGLEIENKSVSNRKFNLSLIDKTRGITFSKAKFLGVHTLLGYKWNVLPAIIGGCRVRLTWRRDTCL